MRKRIGFIILLIAVGLLVFGLASCSPKELRDENYGAAAAVTTTYVLDQDGWWEYTIDVDGTGRGILTGVSWTNKPLDTLFYLYKGLHIPDNVYKIGDDAFSRLLSGAYASSIERVYLPGPTTEKPTQGITIIGDRAFCGTSLSSIYLPSSVSSIGESAFESVKTLSSNSQSPLVIPNGVTEIKARTFANCYGLQEVVIPSSVTVIRANAFALDSGSLSLSNRALRSLTLPSSVITIGESAFEGQERLDRIDIPTSCTYIWEQAFKGCISAKIITIPISVTNIGANAFKSLYSAAKIYADVAQANKPSGWVSTWNSENYTVYWDRANISKLFGLKACYYNASEQDANGTVNWFSKYKELPLNTAFSSNTFAYSVSVPCKYEYCQSWGLQIFSMQKITTVGIKVSPVNTISLGMTGAVKITVEWYPDDASPSNINSVYYNDAGQASTGSGTKWYVSAHSTDYGETRTAKIRITDDGFERLYSVTFTQDTPPLSSDKTLKSLTLTNTNTQANISYGFSSATLTYNVSVAYTVTKVTLTPTLNDSTATIAEKGYDPSGNTLTIGASNKTVLYVKVEAEDKSTQTYTLNITRAEPTLNDIYLSDLAIVGQSISPSFAQNTLSYTASVPFSCPDVTITVTLGNLEVMKVLSAAKQTLQVGENVCKVTVAPTASEQFPNIRKEYVITITRGQPLIEDVFLTAFAVKSGNEALPISPEFSRTEYSYTLSVPYQTDKVVIEADTNASAAVKSGTGEVNVKVGTFNYNVVVEAVGYPALTKTYTVSITRAAPAEADVYLQSLKLSGEKKVNGEAVTTQERVNLTPSYSKNNPVDTIYTASVIFETAYINVDAVAGLNAEVDGIVNERLSVGKNTITITLKSTEEGVTLTRTITIEVTRQTNPNNPSDLGDTDEGDPIGGGGTQDKQVFLTDLAVEGYVISPTFDKEVYKYSVTVPFATTIVTITAVKGGSATSVKGTGTKAVKAGDNKFNIEAVGATGSTTYELTVTRAPIRLSSLSVEGYTIAPFFNPEKFDYTLSAAIPATVNKVTIKAAAADMCTLRNDSGIGEVNLPAGQSVFTVYAYPQGYDGNDPSYRQAYTVKIYRLSGSSDLSSLVVRDSSGTERTLTPAFDKGTLNYTLTVPNVVFFVTVIPTPEDASAILSGTYNRDGDLLYEGENRFSITVNAEDGTKKTYNLTVTREYDDGSTDGGGSGGEGSNPNAPKPDLTIEVLDGEGNSLLTDFDPLTKTYSISVKLENVTVNASETDTTKVRAELSDLGEISLSIGNNFIRIYAYIVGLDKDIVYTILIRRQSAETQLSTLYVVGRPDDLTPAFDPDVTQYTVTVPYEVSSMAFAAVAAGARATVELKFKNTAFAVGESISLEVGENLVTITVYAEDGETSQVYTITVTREEETESKLPPIPNGDDPLDGKTPADVKKLLAWTIPLGVSVIGGNTALGLGLHKRRKLRK